MKLFHSFETTDWNRVGLIVAAATAFWGAMASVLPPKYHAWGAALIGGTTAAVTVLMRSGRAPQQAAKEVVEDIKEKKQEIKEAEETLKKKDQ